MRPAIHDTTIRTRRRMRIVTAATAVGLALTLGGAVEAPAHENGRVNPTAGGQAASLTTGKAAPMVQRGEGGVAVSTAGTPASLAPARRPTGTFVDINLRRQWATMYKGGKKVASFPISSGKRGWRTPTGRYRVYRKLSGWRQSPLGLMWRPAYFVGGFAIHGSRSVPRYAASHGCVRVSMRRWARLSRQMPIGTRVHVHY
jgi:lipoprotein-anchoring transpeptidase ErfK/SrfK